MKISILEVGEKMDKMRFELKMLKYENYIRENPKRPYGYYCLGKLQLSTGNAKAAETCFKKALELDRFYARARLGLIETQILRGNIIKAAYLYNKYSRSLAKKGVYRKELIEFISCEFSSNKINPVKLAFLYKFILKHFMKPQKSKSEKYYRNPVLLLFMCIYYLYSQKTDETSLKVYNECIKLDGLDNNLRWAIVKVLSLQDSSIYQDDMIAGKFTALPSKGCSIEYGNTILKSALKKGNIKKVESILDSLEQMSSFIPLPSLWMFLYLCNKSSIYNDRVLKYCSRLIHSGWIDQLVVKTFLTMKELKIARQTEEEDRILEFYHQPTKQPTFH